MSESCTTSLHTKIMHITSCTPHHAHEHACQYLVNARACRCDGGRRSPCCRCDGGFSRCCRRCCRCRRCCIGARLRVCSGRLGTLHTIAHMMSAPAPHIMTHMLSKHVTHPARRAVPSASRQDFLQLSPLAQLSPLSALLPLSPLLQLSALLHRCQAAGLQLETWHSAHHCAHDVSNSTTHYDTHYAPPPSPREFKQRRQRQCLLLGKSFGLRSSCSSSGGQGGFGG